MSLAHAQQWYVLDYDDLDDGLLRTDGLAQFGLPEVTVADVDPATHAMTDAVVAGLAHRLIAEWPSNDPVGPATVTLRDIAFGLGDAEASRTPRAARSTCSSTTRPDRTGSRAAHGRPGRTRCCSPTAVVESRPCCAG